MASLTGSSPCRVDEGAAFTRNLNIWLPKQIVPQVDWNDVLLPSHRWTNGWQPSKTIVTNGTEFSALLPS